MAASLAQVLAELACCKLRNLLGEWRQLAVRWRFIATGWPSSELVSARQAASGQQPAASSQPGGHGPGAASSRHSRPPLSFTHTEVRLRVRLEKRLRVRLEKRLEKRLPVEEREGQP